ncbi:MAG: AIR synthase family protein [Desulfurococcales archaeon]|nr:AIR synthase family protein [Desulfurococcales archaeon]
MSGRNGKWLGKLSSRDLQRLVLSRLAGFRSPATVIGPSIGEDAAIIDLGVMDLVVHSDPITEAGVLAGRLAVIVSSNDVAVSGARPRWLSLTVVLHEGAGEEELKSVIEGASLEAGRIGVDIVGGHTEVAPGLSKPVVVGTCIGVTCRGCSVPTGGARDGDYVVQVKPAGLEGTAIIATDFAELLTRKGLPRNLVERAAGLADHLSVVREAVELSEAEVVTSMHDPTEGGLIGGLVEMAKASGRDLHVNEAKILVAAETRAIARELGIDPLKLISSGTLLATVPENMLSDALMILSELETPYSVIGRVREGSGRLILNRRTGDIVEYRETPPDEITSLWAGKG